MPLNSIVSAWRKERLGLTMIVASLAVITITVLLLFLHQQREEQAHVREQGTNLVRILSRIPYEQFVPEPGKAGILSVLQQTQNTSALAYLAIVDSAGRHVEEIAGSGVIVPSAPIPADPTGWVGQRMLTMPAGGHQVTEFHAPLFDGGQMAGYVRLGYLRPGFGLSADQVAFIATFALPIFLLTPLFYFLVRREVRPLQQVSSRLDRLMDQGNLTGKVELAVSDELQDFMGRFNRFIDGAQQRIGELEADRSRLVTSSKLLSYKRSRIESVLQSFPDAVMVLDESGTVSLANARIGQVMGVPHEDILGKRPAEWCKDPDIIAFLSGQGGRRGHGYHSDAFEFQPASLSGRTYSISPYPLFSPRDTSELLGTLVVFRDITAEKMAKSSSGEFVAHVSHELKTPLNVLAMYSEMLQGEEGNQEQFRIEAANVIHDEVERLTLLINNILSITKIETGSISIERKRVKLRELLQDTFDACARSGQDKHLDFQLDLPKELGPVALDKDLVRIAINNLLTNAIKYSNENGVVRMSVEETDMAVRISVSDEGIGIPPEEQEKIFEKFYRSHSEEVSSRNGHGLGLSLAREIVQLHHGTLTVNSTPGKGSEFIVEFSKEAGLLRQAV
ncbi:MAG TPA: ATP-binding protein [Gammaproteobacteria bacterium]|nr:ATP-binding protein [Gammaproteobacteria bacterium]